MTEGVVGGVPIWNDVSKAAESFLNGQNHVLVVRKACLQHLKAGGELYY